MAAQLDDGIADTFVSAIPSSNCSTPLASVLIEVAEGPGRSGPKTFEKEKMRCLNLMRNL
jgi:hypothetical protein